MDDEVSDRIRVVEQGQQGGVLGRHHPLVEEFGADPGVQAAPVPRSGEHDREVPDFLGLDPPGNTTNADA